MDITKYFQNYCPYTNLCFSVTFVEKGKFDKKGQGVYIFVVV